MWVFYRRGGQIYSPVIFFSFSMFVLVLGGCESGGIDWGWDFPGSGSGSFLLLHALLIY